MCERIRQNLTASKMLKVIFRYINEVAGERNVDKVLSLISDMAREIVVADRCTIWLLDKKKNQLWTKIAHGIEEFMIPSNTGIVGHSVMNDEQILIKDAYKDSRFNQTVDKATGYRTKSILVIPMKNNEGEVIGAFQAINKMTKSEFFSKSDMEHLVLASTYSAKTIETAFLYKEIEDTQKDVIFTMGEIGETRSKETGNHVKRVAEYSYLLAKKYGLSEDEAELIKLASPMHDIGKVAIPDAILKKPGKLTDREYDKMKKHAELGYEMLKNSERRILKAASVVAGQHHEKYNGKGYPDGISGENIHIYGRITAVADVFDALISDRVYKKAWPAEKVQKLFSKERGEHFDPKLVDILLQNFDKFIEIKEEYKDVFKEEKIILCQ
jgi:response regulator RpfG family c-di-GMP phosphodiesterase